MSKNDSTQSGFKETISGFLKNRLSKINFTANLIIGVVLLLGFVFIGIFAPYITPHDSEEMYYEHLKHSGKYPLIGVNTFQDPDADYADMANHLELARATDDQKDAQLERLNSFKERHQDKSEAALEKLKQTALSGGNMFERLMETVKVCSLGTITQALYEVGGKYRRNM